MPKLLRVGLDPQIHFFLKLQPLQHLQQQLQYDHTFGIQCSTLNRMHIFAHKFGLDKYFVDLTCTTLHMSQQNISENKVFRKLKIKNVNNKP